MPTFSTSFPVVAVGPFVPFEFDQIWRRIPPQEFFRVKPDRARFPIALSALRNEIRDLRVLNGILSLHKMSKLALYSCEMLSAGYGTKCHLQLCDGNILSV